MDTIVPARVALALLLLVTLPYISALFAAGSDAVFAGFLLNPGDGNSYLAKMYQGWSGSWKFTLPFSVDPGHGAYLFTFYLFLGHLGRWLGIPLLLVFHAARLLGAAALAWALWGFFSAVLPDRKYLGYAFALVCFGLGMGWLVFLSGIVTTDFWVAEAYPFLSSYVNPHFPFSLALLIWLLTPASSNPARDPILDPTRETPRQRGAGMHPILVLLAAAWLGSMSPFSIVLVLGILVGLLIWEMAVGKSVPWRSPLLSRVVWVAFGGIPIVVYALLAVRSDPVLAAWNAQNLTPTPALWDLVLSFSPVLLLAVPGAWRVIRSGEKGGRLLLVWAALALGIAVAPFGLQRRFLVGVYVPLVGLAMYGLDSLAPRLGVHLRKLQAIILGLALPSTLLVLLVGQFGVFTRDPRLYLSRDESQALEWLQENTPTGSLILAGPRLGSFIPARAGRRVIYGHPFETVNAAAEENAVKNFYRNLTDPSAVQSFLDEREVDYIYLGPDERALSEMTTLTLPVVYSQGDVTIYAADRR